MFNLFLSFLVALGLSLPSISTLDLLAFMEYLLQAGMSASNISNHLTAIRSMCIIYDCDTSSFRDKRIPLFIKAVKCNRPLQPSLPFVIDELLLHDIVLACSSLHSPIVFKALYLLAFYSFLRLSNILPHSVATFDSTRHLYVGDIIFSDSSAVVVVKWSKTMQYRAKVASVTIPALGTSDICPVAALQNIIHPSSLPNQPLFQIQSSRGITPLTDSVARKHLKQLSIALNTPKMLTFHDFRRAGATWAFRAGVPVQDIQAQGIWSSSCVWRYIILPPPLVLGWPLLSSPICLHDAAYLYLGFGASFFAPIILLYNPVCMILQLTCI